MVAASLQSPIPTPMARPRWLNRLTNEERAQVIECIDDLQFGVGRTYDLTTLSDEALWSLLATEMAASTTSSCDM